MTKDHNADQEDAPSFAGEEEEDGRSTPAKNLGAAAVVGALAVFAMFLSTRLPVPTKIYTAPGLLPFLTGLSLFAMSIALALMAIRQGGAKGFFEKAAIARTEYFQDEENRRTLILVGIIFLYVFLVDFFSFDIQIPLGLFDFRFSSFEMVSIAVLTGVLRIFWRAPSPKCFIVSFFVVLALTASFRYGFKILLPGLG